MSKTIKVKRSVFYVEKTPSGFARIYANGNTSSLTESTILYENARQWIDKVCAISGITSYAITFHEEEYKYHVANLTARAV